MLGLLIFIYSFLAGLIIALIIRFGLCIVRTVISVAWWLVRNICIIFWKVLCWGVLLIVARMRAGRVQAE